MSLAEEIKADAAQECKKYELISNDNSVKYNIIDSSDYTEAQSIERADQNVTEITEVLSTVRSLNAILLVVRATEINICNSFIYAVKRIMKVLPTNSLSRIAIILMFPKYFDASAEQHSIKLLTDLLGNDVEKMKIFKINDSLYSKKCAFMTIKERISYKRLYKRSIQNLGSLLAWIKSVSPFAPSILYENLIQAKARENFALLQLLNKYLLLKNEKEKLEEIELLIAADQSKIFSIDYSTYYTNEYELKDTEYHNTICQDCFILKRKMIVCHEKCHLSYKDHFNAAHFLSCACFINKETCSVCGCGPESHLHTKKQPSEKKVIKTFESEEMKQQYLQASDEITRKRILQNEIRKKIIFFMSELIIYQAEIKNTIYSIDVSVASNKFESHLDNSIKKIESSLKLNREKIV